MKSHITTMATAMIFTSCLCSCHKKQEHTAELNLKDVNCHTLDKTGLCEEKYGANGFEIAEIPEEYREQFLTECGATIPCDVVLTVPSDISIKKGICRIVRMEWKLTM
ncbi:hypothetical protein HW511_10245 [Asaia siamensis]|uniref:Lipoprotein n=1 Tax=Asaia siamensis TaxID=110479 RepID=A0ABQ1M0B3_9PROT|nr:hypothetical protein [Asaia siamensis]GBR10089.1 hypothetical protein AA0323_2694 [Asaia siamensis NRIC 0323]GGC32572.1 hypothetical protein GCM10007207_17570 [Asaia siamensis]